ncbi:MAG: hypothetical protein Kow00122_11460 [Thermoleophilia bacterium]
MEFLVSPVGPGTGELVAAGVGEGVWILGPLGHGFDIQAAVSACSGARGPVPGASAGLVPGGAPGSVPGASAGPARGRLVIVAGGVGVAPFLFVLEDLKSRAAAGGLPAVLTLFGFRDGVQAEALGRFESAIEGLRAVGVSAELGVISEDGSFGRSGLVTTLLAEAALRPGDAVLACGSHGMCAAVWEVCRGAGGVPAWFSLEAAMACGVGSCHGCVVRLSDGSLAEVCRRGPVFAGAEAFGEGGCACAGSGSGESEGR